MATRFLRIEATRDNLYQVLQKIEKEYPSHRWSSTLYKPTEYVPSNANYIYLYDDNTITYSETKFDTGRKISAYDFLNGNNDTVNHPQHYQGKNECIDVMIAMFGVEAVKHFCMCNAYKYRFRADKKNGAEDIAKAEWYESKLIELNSKDK